MTTAQGRPNITRSSHGARANSDLATRPIDLPLATGGSTTSHRFLVECLAGESLEPTVILDGEGPHRFHRLFRTFRTAGLAHVVSRPADAGLHLLTRAIVERERCHGDLYDRESVGSATAIPIVGPSGVVHAVRLDIGTHQGDVEMPVVPVEFDAELIARFGVPHGSVPALFASSSTWTLPALLEQVVWLDKRLELIALFDPGDPESRWCGSLVIEDSNPTKRRHLWMAVRSTTDRHGERVARGIIADITDTTTAPSPDPFTEHLSTRTPRGHGSALMDLRTTLMHSFYCRDDPRMSFWRHRNPQTHPADRFALLQVLSDLEQNRPAQLALRIRFEDEDPWITLHVNCTPLTNYPRPQANIDFWIEPPN
ncbi:GAF domain-containing protein [Nocardia acidivorans]|uniref:GAF domain-containing protein n=1 Tax=Nocardia acidivorans TaxID=404580 RepID=UPI000ADE895B|nr:GAF domain-containing protein [Nocardia acidivorans]